jgi:uncharacterized protein (DUF1499 family)
MTSAPNNASRTKVAMAAFLAGVVAIDALLLGPVMAHLEVVPPFAGFALMALALPMGLAGVVLGVVARRATAPGPPARVRATQGLVLAAVALAVVAFAARPGFGVPRINDITTDLDDPPAFRAAQNLGSASGGDMSYPGEDFARQQAEGYPDLSHKIVEVAPGETVERLVMVLNSMPAVEVTVHDRSNGHIEATATSWLFRFVDDVVVRVTPFENGSKIDIRSKSRDGKGDLGANAARIREIFARLDAWQPPTE